MDLTQEHWWSISLNLKLRESHGDAFQDFFSAIMEKMHGDDFVRVRAFGQLGDKGCDGYLLSSGQLFQCYGALNGDKNKVKTLVGKMKEDFEKSKLQLSSIMTEWYMVHNLVDGLPVEAILVIKSLEEENPSIKFGFIGKEGVAARIAGLDESDKVQLLGPAATNADSLDFQLEELRDLVKNFVAVYSNGEPILENIDPVPVDKLDANNLPNHWHALISAGWKNAHIVSKYLGDHTDPLIGANTAEMFNHRYSYLKAQHLSPELIMDSLYEYVTGIGTVSPARQVAAQALLAHFFESCDIFENIHRELI